MIKDFLRNVLYVLRIDKIFKAFPQIVTEVYLKRIERNYGIKINFVNQGDGGITIGGDISKFKIDPTSHLKSNTFIECTGGVEIGKYFHTGRGLTIFSTNHNYDSNIAIPYDNTNILKQVIIGDFVWCGANVTIMPGVSIGEGVVVGGGSVVTRDIPSFAVIGGNPAIILKYRDIEVFKKLKFQGKFF
ncbi:MAG: acyltransferase [Pyrinomonadaceae bacterium]|nr:acyltransferase [Sphingobacteriaceae bacterium]